MTSEIGNADEPAEAPQETPQQRKARLLSGECRVFSPPDDGDPLFLVTSFFPMPDGRRCHNFLDMQEMCNLLNEDAAQPPAGVLAYEGCIEQAFDSLDRAKRAIECVPPSRERSLAMTKIEEAQMWFQRAVPPVNAACR